MSNLLVLGAHRSYHLYRKETDMRKGFNQLCGIVANILPQAIMNTFDGNIRTKQQLLHRGKTVQFAKKVR